jgi:hypothetical protein
LRFEGAPSAATSTVLRSNGVGVEASITSPGS